jgi:hypothetical protein
MVARTEGAPLQPAERFLFAHSGKNRAGIAISPMVPTVLLG